jgi:hypothetical protein
VRLVLRDLHTGDTGFVEDGVVGRIGRSCGALKVPLLVEGEQVFRSPITCDRIIAILDWETGLPLYRHPSYRAPELSLLCERAQTDSLSGGTCVRTVAGVRRPHRRSGIRIWEMDRVETEHRGGVCSADTLWGEECARRSVAA